MYNSRPEYGCFAIDTGARMTPTSAGLGAGTLTSGTVDDIQEVDNAYMEVNESDKFDIQFLFTEMIGNPVKLEVVGHYDGGGGHVVWLWIYNYNTETWDRVTNASEDFDAQTSDVTYSFDLNLIPSLSDLSDYVSSASESLFSILHDSNANGQHDFFLNYAALVEETYNIPSANEHIQLSGFNVHADKNMTMDGTNGIITVLTDGDYAISTSMTYLATANTRIVFHMHFGASGHSSLWETLLDSNGEVERASSTEIRGLKAGDQITFEIQSNTAQTSISVLSFRADVIKVS